MPLDPGPAISGWLPLTHGVEVAAPDLTPELRNRVDAAFKQMRKNLSTSLYADRPDDPPMPPTIRQRIRRYLNRAHDAWLVLTGRAEIG